MLVVPLIFFSIVSGVASIGDLRKLGAVGWRALLLFLVTSQIAVWLGLALGTIFASRASASTPVAASSVGAAARAERATSARHDPRHRPGKARSQVMADAQVLPLIVFALLVGIGIVMADEEGGPACAGSSIAARW